ncbi:hypothetical protein Poly24_01160 [Rosistilla carotiformis]|uniref:Uncharacterized protein n=1 Tax=Rosistilla carotiformis TaxID=2528017 RepID=A0A518JLK9_9BACT|nr:hypothetical protein Poly24_01160 [Rosistilla carotiformis]
MMGDPVFPSRLHRAGCAMEAFPPQSTRLLGGEVSYYFCCDAMAAWGIFDPSGARRHPSSAIH